MPEREILNTHKYRCDKGIYPADMIPVVRELIAEAERAQRERDEIDQAFFAWRQNHPVRAGAGS